MIMKSFTKNIVINLCVCFFSFPLLAIENETVEDDKITNEFVENIIMKEKAGVRYYKNGKYQIAFDKLTYSAKRGLKLSQYLLGIMYLKGQHVEQSLFYGMAWLGVAKESKAKEWVTLFDEIYAKATPEEQQAIATNTAKFIEKYGMKAQAITCNKRARLGERKIIRECTKNGKVFDIPRIDSNQSIFKNQY